MRLIYAYIKEFRNIVNQEIYFSQDYKISYDSSTTFPQAILIKAMEPSVPYSVIHKDSKLSNVHIVMGKTGAGKTNIFQLIGMTEEERVENEENRGSYFLLYETEGFFLIEPFNIAVDEALKRRDEKVDDPSDARLPEYIKEYSRLWKSMQMFSFSIDHTGKPVNIKPETISTLKDNHTFIFNGYDRNAFTYCPYPEEREDLTRGNPYWQERELAEFNRTVLLCSCRILKEYIEGFDPDNLKRKAAIVIRCDCISSLPLS